MISIIAVKKKGKKKRFIKKGEANHSLIFLADSMKE